MQYEQATSNCYYMLAMVKVIYLIGFSLKLIAGDLAALQSW